MDSSWKNSWHIFFSIRIMPLSWVMALSKNMYEILSAKYLKSCWSESLETWWIDWYWWIDDLINFWIKILTITWWVMALYNFGHFYFAHFLMHSMFWTLHARVLKFHIWIPHEKIADTYFFFELWPFEKCGLNLVSKLSEKLLKLEPWNLRNVLVAMSKWPD